MRTSIRPGLLAALVAAAVAALLGAALPGASPSAGAAPACTITGNNGDNELNGTPGRDVICGLGGDDTLRGFGGADVVRGGGGDDIVYGGAGPRLWRPRRGHRPHPGRDQRQRPRRRRSDDRRLLPGRCGGRAGALSVGQSCSSAFGGPLRRASGSKRRSGRLRGGRFAAHSDALVSA